MKHLSTNPWGQHCTAGERYNARWGKVLTPTAAEVDATSEAGANPKTLCANWRKGCNGVTDGPTADGKLSLCDDCKHTN